MPKAKEKIDWSVFARGAAGRSARIKGLREGSKYIIPVLVLSFVPLFIFLKWRGAVGLSWMITIFVIVIVTIKHLEKKADRVVDSWLAGAQGEGLVARALKELESDDFRFIHDLPNGHGNIDHFAICRTGLFVIETKRWSGRIHYTDGKLCRNGWPLDKDPVKQVKKQALYLSKKVEAVLGRQLWVEPILCFVGTSIDPNAATVEDVNLTSLRFLRRHVTKGKVVLNQEQIAQIRAAAEQWR